MKIEVGKRYIRRDGLVTNPVEYDDRGATDAFWCVAEGDNRGVRRYTSEGVHYFGDRERDLVREYVEPPCPCPTRADLVNAPPHYRAGDTYETIRVIEAWGLDFCLGNTVKYISRAGKKDAATELQDLEKGAWYLARRIQQLKGGAK